MEQEFEIQPIQYVGHIYFKIRDKAVFQELAKSFHISRFPADA